VAGVEDDVVVARVQAALVPSDLPVLGEHPVLVASLIQITLAHCFYVSYLVMFTRSSI
jgi:hypothetical protein